MMKIHLVVIVVMALAIAKKHRKQKQIHIESGSILKKKMVNTKQMKNSSFERRLKTKKIGDDDFNYQYRQIQVKSTSEISTIKDSEFYIDNQDTSQGTIKSATALSPFDIESLKQFTLEYFIGKDLKEDMVVKFKTQSGELRDFIDTKLIRYKVFCGESYKISNINSLLSQKPFDKDQLASLKTQVSSKGEKLEDFLKEASDLQKDDQCEATVDMDIVDLKQMVQQLKTDKAKDKDNKMSYGYQLIGNRDFRPEQQQNFIYQAKYYSVSRLRMEDKQFDNVGITGMERSGLKCYISYDINSIVFNGFEAGGERFNVPFDYFRSAMLHISKSKPEISFNPRFQSTTLYFNEMREIETYLEDQDSKCIPKFQINPSQITASLLSKFYNVEEKKTMFQELMTMAQFQTNFNRDYSQAIARFISGESAVFKIEKYCVKILKTFKIFDGRYKQGTKNVGDYQTKDMDYFSWNNRGQYFDLEYVEGADDQKKKLKLDKLKIDMAKYHKDDMIRLVVISHRNCLIHKLFGKPLQE